MPGCATRCTTFRTDTRDNAWTDVRDHFGPRVAIGTTIYTNDMNEWTIWANENGADPVTDITKFGNWLVWKCSFGTTNYGNLATRVRDHEGVSCVPCPYNSTAHAADPDRAEIWLGFTPTSLVDHGDNYMRVAQRGSSWGWECTYSGCSYLLDNGTPYFHV